MDPLSALLDAVLRKPEPVTVHTHHDPGEYSPAELREAFDVVEQLDRGPFFLLAEPGACDS